jgi:hypothetical protein
MRIGRVIALLWAGFMLAMAGAAVAALRMKQRIVPNASVEANEVQLVAIFEPIAFESRSMAFRGGRADLWYGGGIIDLRKAILDPAGARLEVRAVFGGCQLLVPDSWQVTTQVRGIGGAGDGRPRIDRPADAPRLTVEGIVFFGGVGIASDIPEEAARSVREAVAKRAPQQTTGPGVPVMEPEPEPVIS